MIDFFLSIVESWSSKLNGWAWRLRWSNRETGTGYKRKYEKRNLITTDLHKTKYRNRVVPNKKKKEELKRLKRFYILEYLR